MWHKEALLLEIKRRAVYVYDFWMKMFIPPLIQIIVAYYLWQALYEQQGGGLIGGYTFSQMMLYYVVASSVYQMVQPDIGLVLRDIYDGTLTKYLFYPLSFFQFKFLAHLAQMLLVSIQFVIAITAYLIFFNAGGSFHIGFSQVAMGVSSVFIAGYLFFIISVSLETLGFWVETVWGLVLMLQFVTNLLGGKLIPLSVFPVWLSKSLFYLPFPYMVSFPTRAFLGEVSMQEFCLGILISIFWSIIFSFLARFVWERGSFNYSGTGM